MSFTRLYYNLKPFIPRRIQILLRRQMVLRRRQLFKNIWPIDENAGKLPDGWLGWPDGKCFALVLTHDVDTAKGYDRCYDLMELEQRLGFRSSFNFVPARYEVTPDLRRELTQNGFEVGIHGLKHDGRLYESQRTFKERANRINDYLREWGSVGFRSPSMHHNLDWIHELNIKYDASTFDTDPFEPQTDGVGTIFPFWVEEDSSQNGYVELPYTLPQDFTLFVLMKERNTDIWKKKLGWIAEKGGMALMNTHPDYMVFDRLKRSVEEYPSDYYIELLDHIKTMYEGQYWHPLPKEMAHFWSNSFASRGHRKTDYRKLA